MRSATRPARIAKGRAVPQPAMVETAPAEDLPFPPTGMIRPVGSGALRAATGPHPRHEQPQTDEQKVQVVA